MTRNQRLSAARLWAHDRICYSRCEGAERADHAKRTMHGFAVEADRDWQDDKPLVDIIHKRFCLVPDCRPARHSDALYEAAADLRATLGGAA